MKFFLICCAAWGLAAAPPSLHIKAAESALRRAELGRSTRDWASAEKQYLLAIDIEPSFMEAYDGLLKVYLDTDRPTEAGAILTRILQIEPNSGKHRLLLGNLLLQARQPMRALAQFAAAMQISVDSDSFYGFARAAAASGLNDKALEAATRGAEQFPNDTRFRRILDRLRAAPSRDIK